MLAERGESIRVAMEAMEAAMKQLKVDMETSATATYNKCEKGWQDQAMIHGKKLDDIDKLVKGLEEQLRNGDRAGARSRFNHKDAKDVKPGPWDDKTMFADLAMEMRIWARTFHGDFVDLIDKAEKRFVETGEFQTTENINSALYPDFTQIDRYLYNMLAVTVKGDAKAYVKNTEESGFQAWAQMIQHFDPRGTVDRTVAYGRLVNPVPHFGQAGSTDQIRQVMQK